VHRELRHNNGNCVITNAIYEYSGNCPLRANHQVGNFGNREIDVSRLLANAAKRSKMAREHVLFVVHFVKILVSEDFIYDKNFMKSC